MSVWGLSEISLISQSPLVVGKSSMLGAALMVGLMTFELMVVSLLVVLVDVDRRGGKEAIARDWLKGNLITA